MTLQEAKTLAVLLICKHSLDKGGWRFMFDKAKRRFGRCNHSRRIISLSAPLTEANSEEQVKDTILHEIAHALVGPGHGHNEVWKAKCVEVGCKPVRCYSSEEVIKVDKGYKATCGACGSVYHRYKRVLRGRVSCKCQRGIDWSKRVLLHFEK